MADRNDNVVSTIVNLDGDIGSHFIQEACVLSLTSLTEGSIELCFWVDEENVEVADHSGCSTYHRTER